MNDHVDETIDVGVCAQYVLEHRCVLICSRTRFVFVCVHTSTLFCGRFCVYVAALLCEHMLPQTPARAM
jgi:hypothetical protein